MMGQERSKQGVKCLNSFIKTMNFNVTDPSTQIRGTTTDYIQITPTLANGDGIKAYFLQTTYKGERTPLDGKHPTSHEDLIIEATLPMMLNQPYAVITVKAASQEEPALYWASMCQKVDSRFIRVATLRSSLLSEKQYLTKEHLERLSYQMLQEKFRRNIRNYLDYELVYMFKGYQLKALRPFNI